MVEVRARRPPISEKAPARRKRIRCFGEFAVTAQEVDVAVVVIRLEVRARAIHPRYRPGYIFVHRPDDPYTYRSGSTRQVRLSRASERSITRFEDAHAEVGADGGVARTPAMVSRASERSGVRHHSRRSLG